MSIPNPFSGKGAPPPPDYAGVARQQTAANRPNQMTPWASSKWTQGPGDTWSQNVSLDPHLQGASDAMTGQLGSAWSSPLDSGAGARDKAESAIYGRAASRLDPMWGQREHDLTTTLANQGIDPNSAAYGKSLDNFGRSRNDAYSSALMEAIMGGGQEGQRQQQMDLTSRMAPLQGLSGIRSLTSMPGAPGAGDMLGAAGMQGQYGLQSAQMNQQFWKDLLQGGSGLGLGIAAL